jgi:NAD(P)-dependent dehydrogenase (short-subunit alcohol dehydrogenase family)
MRTALVTGATDGHGAYVARGLAERGWRVLVHGRSVERGGQVLAELGGEGEHALLLADLASLDAVRALVGDVAARAPVELVVCNAGIISPQREASADGVELTFAVNHLAHVVLCEELVRREAGVRRIVSVASLSQHAFDWDDPLLERSYEPWRAYGQSKLAQVAWTFDLAELWGPRGITLDALHPATFMDTTMVRESVGTPHTTVAQGGDATLRLIEDDGGTGRFFDGTRETRAAGPAYDAGERERIHELTARYL